jgi:asparagine synthetase B (glutamine-hydrolysing)
MLKNGIHLYRSGFKRVGFIELRSTRNSAQFTAKSLRGHKLVMFTAQTKKLFFVANLNNENLDNNGFYVINEDESKIKNNIYSATLEHRKAAEEGCSFLPGGIDEPIVIILLKKPFKDPVVDAIWN